MEAPLPSIKGRPPRLSERRASASSTANPRKDRGRRAASRFALARSSSIVRSVPSGMWTAASTNAQRCAAASTELAFEVSAICRIATNGAARPCAKADAPASSNSSASMNSHPSTKEISACSRPCQCTLIPSRTASPAGRASRFLPSCSRHHARRIWPSIGSFVPATIRARRISSSRNIVNAGRHSTIVWATANCASTGRLSEELSTIRRAASLR